MDIMHIGEMAIEINWNWKKLTSGHVTPHFYFNCNIFYYTAILMRYMFGNIKAALKQYALWKVLYKKMYGDWIFLWIFIVVLNRDTQRLIFPCRSDYDTWILRNGRYWSDSILALFFRVAYFIFLLPEVDSS